MLTVRNEMWSKLADDTHARFVARVTAHLRRFFPTEIEALGEGRLAELIDAGVTGARSWGFISEADICQYVDLMCVFGPGLDANPALSWVREILVSHGPPDPSNRIRRLQKVASAALMNKKVGDPMNQVQGLVVNAVDSGPNPVEQVPDQAASLANSIQDCLSSFSTLPVGAPDGELPLKKLGDAEKATLMQALSDAKAMLIKGKQALSKLDVDTQAKLKSLFGTAVGTTDQIAKKVSDTIDKVKVQIDRMTTDSFQRATGDAKAAMTCVESTVADKVSVGGAFFKDTMNAAQERATALVQQAAQMDGIGMQDIANGRKDCQVLAQSVPSLASQNAGSLAEFLAA